MQQQLLSATDVATLFGVGKSTVWRWARLGSLPEPVRICGTTRWRRDDIEDRIRAGSARPRPKLADLGEPAEYVAPGDEDEGVEGEA